MEIHDLKPFLLLLLVSSAFAAVPDGYLVRVDSATAYLDWGKASGVQIGDTFEVYRAGPVLKHPVTGEVLGQAENVIGQGVVETIEDKFAAGHIVERQSEFKAGDRTRIKTAAPPAVAASSTSNVPQAIWQSTPIAGTPRSIAIGDVESSGSNDVVLAFQDRLELYRWQSDHLEKLTAYTSSHDTNWLTVDVADPEHSGRSKIFATWYLEGIDRARVAVIEWSSGTLKETSHFDGFARVFPRADGSRPLLVQDLGLGRELRISAPKFVTAVNGKYKAGASVPLAHPLGDSQLFGYAWGDWDDDKSEDFTYLLNGERLGIFFKGKKWTGETLYGGTKLSFSYNRSFDAVATLYPRLAPIKNSAGKELLLTSYNESATGLRFLRINTFRSGQILAMGWNGTDMTPVWRVPTASYIADYAAGSVSDAKQSELWILTESAGSKSVISGYKLP